MAYTLFGFKDGALAVESDRAKYRKLFDAGAIGIVTLESKTDVTRVVSQYATLVGMTYYLNAALDKPFETIDAFFELCTIVEQSVKPQSERKDTHL
jgi:hypothetical protein